jgi:hypothetical protein
MDHYAEDGVEDMGDAFSDNPVTNTLTDNAVT